MIFIFASVSVNYQNCKKKKRVCFLFETSTKWENFKLQEGPQFSRSFNTEKENQKEFWEKQKTVSYKVNFFFTSNQKRKMRERNRTIRPKKEVGKLCICRFFFFCFFCLGHGRNSKKKQFWQAEEINKNITFLNLALRTKKQSWKICLCLKLMPQFLGLWGYHCVARARHNCYLKQSIWLNYFEK